jgi:hypothetical protein
METRTLTCEHATGYAGKRSRKSYVAKITGTDRTYIFARDFLETTPTEPAEAFAARRKGRGTWTEAAACEVGLYEIQECGDRRYVMVWLRARDGALRTQTMTPERCQAMALLLDAGATFESARVQTQPDAPTVK